MYKKKNLLKKSINIYLNNNIIIIIIMIVLFIIKR